MRIGFDAKRYFFNRTGLGNYSRSIVHSLAAHFPKDDFCLFSAKPSEVNSPFPNLKTIVPAKSNFLWRRFGIVNAMREERIEVYHGLSNEIPSHLAKNNIKSVVTIHDVIFKRYPQYYSWTDRQLYHFKTKHAVAHSERIIATSEATAKDLVRYYNANEKKIEVVYQPVNDAWYLPSGLPPSESQPYYLYISSFTHRKNHGALIQAFSRIHKQTDLNLVLAGASGESLAFCQNFIEDEKIQDKVKIYTNCGLNELISLAENAHSFVYPSLFEGFGIPLAEAAVKGLPMAVSKIEVFKELAAGAALYFNPNNCDEMAASLLELLRLEYTLPMKKAREELVQKIQPEMIASQLMNIYKSIY
jgi:glycosyltransferase involved in cell wall biosynthesis